jgi:pantothenate kinase
MRDPVEAFARRGAPFTFDAAKFVQAVASIKNSPSTRPTQISLPGFDHAVQDPVDNEIIVTADAKVVLLEGNYVLLNEKPWDEISKMVDDK